MFSPTFGEFENRKSYTVPEKPGPIYIRGHKELSKTQLGYPLFSLGKGRGTFRT